MPQWRGKEKERGETQRHATPKMIDADGTSRRVGRVIARWGSADLREYSSFYSEDVSHQPGTHLFFFLLLAVFDYRQKRRFAGGWVFPGNLKRGQLRRTNRQKYPY